MPCHETIRVEVDGRQWSGDWELQGREICVGSAYGSQTRAYGRRAPERVAKEVLSDLVKQWLKR